MTDDTRRIITRFVLVAIALPTAIVLAGSAVMLAVWPTLPDPIATHWGAGGVPDGFGPVWLPLVLLVVTGLGLPLLLALLTLPGLRRGDRGVTYRVLGALALALSTFLGVLVTLSAVRQAGLIDAADGPAIWVPMIAALIAAAVAGTAGWFVQPRQRFQPTPVAPALPTALAPGERVAWLQRVSIARSGIVVLVSAIALLVVMTVVAAVTGADAAAFWILVTVTAVLSLLVAANTVFHVRVDDDGLSVTSAFGWPRVRVPLADVRDAAAVEVNPMGEFGGWGLRWGPAGKFGVVLRTGVGIEVRRRNGKTFTVTVDDAETGAALLNALAARPAAGDRSATGRTAGDR